MRELGWSQRDGRFCKEKCFPPPGQKETPRKFYDHPQCPMHSQFTAHRFKERLRRKELASVFAESQMQRPGLWSSAGTKEVAVDSKTGSKLHNECLGAIFLWTIDALGGHTPQNWHNLELIPSCLYIQGSLLVEGHIGCQESNTISPMEGKYPPLLSYHSGSSQFWTRRLLPPFSGARNTLRWNQ